MGKGRRQTKRRTTTCFGHRPLHERYVDTGTEGAAARVDSEGGPRGPVSVDLYETDPLYMCLLGFVKCGRPVDSGP